MKTLKQQAPLVLLFCAAVALAGCQSYSEGVAVICNAPTECPECMSAAPADRSRVLAVHIDDNLSNGEAKTLMEGLAMLATSEKVAQLRGTAAEHGLASCPLADAIEALEREEQ